GRGDRRRAQKSRRVRRPSLHAFATASCASSAGAVGWSIGSGAGVPVIPSVLLVVFLVVALATIPRRQPRRGDDVELRMRVARLRADAELAREHGLRHVACSPADALELID